MKVKILYSFGIVLLHVLAIGLIMNALYEWVCAVISILFMGFMTWLIQKSYGDKNSILFSLIYSLIMLLMTVISFHLRNNIPGLVQWLIPFLTLITPFTGLSYITFIPDTIMILIPIIVSLIWVIISSANLYLSIRKTTK